MQIPVWRLLGLAWVNQQKIPEVTQIGEKFVKANNVQRRKIGLVGFWDTVAFDEVGGIKIKDPDTIQIMKDFLANGRFSRGVEVIAEASMTFVGNLDLSVEQIVNSEVYDLFQPLPTEFDLAVQDRFACYLPGWEMPKNSSEFLTGNYGFITDYLAEAFHHQFKQNNRYEEVSSRVKLGESVEGRDEKGIKKILCAFLKILHPHGKPTDEEFEEYVAYAVESRRRIKEQMNKRKTDDEFSRINLSYFNTSGKEVVVYCPESRAANATQEPSRRNIHAGDAEAAEVAFANESPESEDVPASATSEETVITADSSDPSPQLEESHFTIHYGDTGYSYDSLILPYLQKAKLVEIDDPYIRANHQVHNFVRFCEAVAKAPTVRKIALTTSYDQDTDLKSLNDRFEELKQSLLELDIELNILVNEKLHDREIRIDNGWVVKIGRGLDFYQKPDLWFGIGSHDLSMRRCLETKVDIYKNKF
jgi:ATP-dependent Lon protease